MAYAILNSDPFQGYRFKNQGDLAIVFEGPYAKAQAPHPLHAQTFERILGWNLSNRLASIHFVCAYHKEEGKERYPLRELRRGWARVATEIACITSVKRILLISQSALLTQVVMPGVAGLADTHGTIFTLESGLEVVPTWFKAYEHMSDWKESDIKRWKLLVKDSPLPFQHSLKRLTGNRIIVDLETTGLDSSTDQITVLGVQWSDTERALIMGGNIHFCITQLTERIKQGAHIYFHNAQFDLGFMGQEFRDACTDFNAVHCTMIRARARGELVNTLKHLGNIYTDRPGNYAYATPNEKHDFTDVRYVCEDLQTTWELAKRFDIDDAKPVVKQFEPAIVMCAEQTREGTCIDVTQLHDLHTKGLADIIRLEAECLAEYGIHPGKTKEMVQVVLSRGHELTKKTPAGAFTLDEEVCEEHGLILLLQYRRAVKLDSSFIGKLVKLIREDNTVPHYQSMLGAETGRTTMKNFNWQQASKKGALRSLVISRYKNGKILIVDLAQAELRVLAYISNDEVFAELFSKEDPHRSNASRAFEIPESEVTEDQRFDAKAVVFRTVYGGSSQNAGQRRVEVFFKSSFRKAFLWIEAIKMFSKQKLEVTDAYGKTRNLREVKTWRGLGGVGRAGINSPIQGIASHIAMQVTYNAWWLFRKYKLRSKVIFGVHDSLMADIHPDELGIATQLVRLAFAMLRDSHMYKAFPLAKSLAMQGELMIGDSWGSVDAGKKTLTKVVCSSLDPITEADIEQGYSDGLFTLSA